MAYSFNDAEAPTKKKVQYYEMFGNRAIWVDGWQAVTLHGKRMPWITNSVTPFEDDVWELYNLNEDFSGAVDLADKYPEKLAELQQRFDEEAWKYNVYPLFDDMIMRLSRQQDRQFGDKKEFTFYYPGAVRIAEKASPPIKGRSHLISTKINFTGDEQGVLVACGGFTGGYTAFIKDGKFIYDYNFLDGVHYVMESPKLAKGENTLEVKFIHEGKFAGHAELYVNGEKVDQVAMPQTHISTFSLSEPFDVGVDNGTPVSTLYSDAFPYTGELDKVVFKLLD